MARTLKATCSRFVRGLILLLWILGLSVVALGSLQGILAEFLLSANLVVNPLGIGGIVKPEFVTLGSDVQRGCPTGDDILVSFRYFETNLPPIEDVLDVVQPTWRSAVKPPVPCGPSDQLSVYQTYHSLFTKVTERLRSLARNDNLDPKAVVIDATILPPEFPGKAVSEKMSLPLEVQDWLTREKSWLKGENQARALVNTFLLLSVLGAFGSLIFLIRDYITTDDARTISDYMFRPILGIFLAVAVFIVDILAHSVISTSSILEIRYEPLYILALGAGLLSETAYAWVRRNADFAFARRSEEAKSAGKNANIHEAEPRRTDAYAYDADEHVLDPLRAETAGAKIDEAESRGSDADDADERLKPIATETANVGSPPVVPEKSKPRWFGFMSRNR